MGRPFQNGLLCSLSKRLSRKELYRKRFSKDFLTENLTYYIRHGARFSSQTTTWSSSKGRRRATNLPFLNEYLYINFSSLTVRIKLNNFILFYYKILKKFLRKCLLYLSTPRIFKKLSLRDGSSLLNIFKKLSLADGFRLPNLKKLSFAAVSCFLNAC